VSFRLVEEGRLTLDQCRVGAGETIAPLRAYWVLRFVKKKAPPDKDGAC